MQISHGNVLATASVRVETAVHGVAPRWNRELDSEATPGHLIVHYSLTEGVWTAGVVSLATAEGSNSSAVWHWCTQDGALRAIDNTGRMPSWLAALVDSLRPTGALTLPN